MKIATFEGVDHCGKSRQAMKLVINLKDKGYKVLFEHFPRYNDKIGALIGEIIQGDLNIDHTALEMLYAADQTDFRKVIEANNDVDYVILDRYDLSTVVYYMATYGYNRINFKDITSFQKKILEPDITFITDIDVDTALSRENIASDKFEKDRKFLDRVCLIYEDIETYYKGSARQFVHLDGMKPLDTLNNEIFECVNKLK